VHLFPCFFGAKILILKDRGPGWDRCGNPLIRERLFALSSSGRALFDKLPVALCNSGMINRQIDRHRDAYGSRNLVSFFPFLRVGKWALREPEPLGRCVRSRSADSVTDFGTPPSHGGSRHSWNSSKFDQWYRPIMSPVPRGIWGHRRHYCR